MDKIIKVANLFKVDAPVVTAEKYGCGHINDTYKLTDEKGKFYILQKINHKVFRNVKGLMENIVGVTEHIYKQMLSKGMPTEDCLRVIETKDGASYYGDDEVGYFRMYNFVYGGISIESSPTKEQFEVSAIGFGRFQKMLDGYPAETIQDSIPNFHNTVSRFENFEKAVQEDPEDRLCQVMEEVDWFYRRKKYCSQILDLIEEGEIPLRVTHNDTKLNNVLVNIETMTPVAVIDLDTVMKGSILYDFGDSIRSGTNTGAEDEKDLSKVDFSLELYEAYVKGFLSEVKDTLTPTESENLSFGAILMTYECGLRFLTDYLEGDHYFKVHRARHNLDRCRTQIKMVEKMEEHFDEMDAIVKKYL
ncbi:MAG: aminoglycoside phosphotransferase family protein [Clostridia bacterium]|nr:aminoglycoside phosphotransferase family protein [Clostridia bacterium]